MSTKQEIEVTYGVSNDFFRLWLDKRMTYSCGLYLSSDDNLDQAQTSKLEYHCGAARVTSGSRVLDIGCGWGSNLEFLAREKNVRDVVGITLSEKQYQEVMKRNIPNASVECISYVDYKPSQPFDAIVSIGMFEHIATSEDIRNGRHYDLYREYFRKVYQWSKPGAWFSLQTIIGVRVPRGEALKEMAWVAAEIFPGAMSPRLEAIMESTMPYWEVMEVYTRREHYARTTDAWLRRLKANKDVIIERWGEKMFTRYKRYLSACVMSFEHNYQSLIQMSLKRMD